MIKKPLKFLICTSLICCMIPTMVFAETDAVSQRNEDVTQLKLDISEALNDNKLSEKEVNKYHFEYVNDYGHRNHRICSRKQ